MPEPMLNVGLYLDGCPEEGGVRLIQGTPEVLNGLRKGLLWTQTRHPRGRTHRVGATLRSMTDDSGIDLNSPPDGPE